MTRSGRRAATSIPKAWRGFPYRSQERWRSGRNADPADTPMLDACYADLFMLRTFTTSFSSQQAFINHMPSAFRISSPRFTYSARQSGLRSVAGLMLCTGAPFMTFLIGTNQSAMYKYQLTQQPTFYFLSRQCNGYIANLDDPSWDMTSASSDTYRGLDLLD